MDEHSERHVNARYERLAQRVRDELAAAGLPVTAPGLDRRFASGAEVRVSTWNQHFGAADPEVLVSWLVSPRLRGRAMEDAERLNEVTGAVRQSGEAQTAMAAAMIAILSAAGYTARDHGNEYSPFDVQVLAGPERRTAPAWADRDASPDGADGGPGN